MTLQLNKIFKRCFNRSLNKRVETFTDINNLMEHDFTFEGKRIFKPKDTYEPSDLNDVYMEKRFKGTLKLPKPDVFEILSIDPLKNYRNVAMLSHFITSMGHIKPQAETGLSFSNQKKVSKAIRRAKAMGLMPYCYKVKIPELSPQDALFYQKYSALISK